MQNPLASKQECHELSRQEKLGFMLFKVAAEIEISYVIS